MFLDLNYLLAPDILSKFLSGLCITLKISFLSIVGSVLIGLIGAFLQAFPILRLNRLVECYIQLFRNMPLLIQLYFYYRGLQCIGILLSPEQCGILALTLYTGAYLIETFRAGISSIPLQQREAAKSLGFSNLQTYALILLPQACRMILPPLGNLLISLVKNSSLVAFISVEDLFYVVYKGAVDDFRPMEFFLTGLMLYGGITLLISALIHGLETLVKLGVFRRYSPLYEKLYAALGRSRDIGVA